MKYRLTEEQLNSLIAESTIRILRESSEDEGIGGTLGKGLGWLARKTANGVKDFGKNFGQQWGGQGQGQANNTDTEKESLTQMQQTIQTLSKQLASLQQIVNNGGGNAAGNGNAANGGNAAGGGNNTNGGNAAGNGNAANGGNAAGGGQNNKAYDNMSDEDLANSGMLSGGKPMAPKTKKSYMPNQTFTQDSYNQMKAQGQERPRISEAKLNQIVAESIRKVLNGK